MAPAKLLISPEYARLNWILHETRPTYGGTSLKWKAKVKDLLEAYDARSVLDYGCGKGLLGRSVKGVDWRNYDPAVPAFSALPSSADLVVCTDVLEHVEPDCLDAVLDHLLALGEKAAFLVVATRPAQKSLPDGRNAHLIVQPMEWWMERLIPRWLIVGEGGDDREFWIVGVPKA